MNRVKKLLLAIFIVIFIFLNPLCSFAHSGRTDSNGGHYDRTTGEYHYHHGYPAHQHTNGICPYNFVDKTNHNSNTSNNSNNNSSNESTGFFVFLGILSLPFVFGCLVNLYDNIKGKIINKSNNSNENRYFNSTNYKSDEKVNNENAFNREKEKIEELYSDDKIDSIIIFPNDVRINERNVLFDPLYCYRQYGRYTAYRYISNYSIFNSENGTFENVSDIIHFDNQCIPYRGICKCINVLNCKKINNYVECPKCLKYKKYDNTLVKEINLLRERVEKYNIHTQKIDRIMSINPVGEYYYEKIEVLSKAYVSKSGKKYHAIKGCCGADIELSKITDKYTRCSKCAYMINGKRIRFELNQL